MPPSASAPGRDALANGRPRLDIDFCGEAITLDARGVIYLPERRLLAAADLHLEKGSRFAANGRLAPPLDTHDALIRLAACLDDYRPQTMLCLGDSFHDSHAGARIAAADRAALTDLIRCAPAWIWVSGNHDPRPPTGLPGEALDRLDIGAITFQHAPEANPARPQIAGHLHPKAAYKARRQTVSGRCFLSGARHLILPAFGAFAGGLDCAHPAIAAIFAPQAPRRRLIYGGKLWNVA